MENESESLHHWNGLTLVMTFSILETILILLSVALIISVIFKHLNLSVILGYILAGMLMGPHTLGLIPDLEIIKQLADFGIIFLMFAIGLEFSQPKLLSLKYPVLVIGVLQVALSIAITVFIGLALQMTLLVSLIIGGIVAMSSTAIVLKQLKDQNQLNTIPGLNAVGVLLFQDLAVIPFIILIVSLSLNLSSSLPITIFWAFLKGFLAIIFITSVGRWLLKPLFHFISKTKTLELFRLTVLIITLVAAWITNFLGLSFSLGAFLAGMMLSETEFKHRIEIEIRPFRDILLGLFFVSIGMLADINQWPALWKGMTLLLTGIIVGKLLLITIICRLIGNSNENALRTGIVLAQGSEFGFAILTIAFSHNMLPHLYGQSILGALLISMSIAPLLIHYNQKISTWFFPNAPNKNGETKYPHPPNQELSQHVIICGFGRVGQHVAKVLEKFDIPFIGIDHDAQLIEKINFTDSVILEDATHPEILQIAGIKRAKALVIGFNDIESAIKILNYARQEKLNIPILVRCRDQNEFTKLKKHGATKIISELFEESIVLSQTLLQSIHIPERRISEIIIETRSQGYDLGQTSDSTQKKVEKGNTQKIYGNSLGFGKHFALLVSDMQNAYTDPSYERGMEQNSQIQVINKIIKTCRTKHFPIFFTIIAFDNNNMIDNLWVKKVRGLSDLQKNSELIKINKQINYQPNKDIVVVKQFPSAFYQTSLFSELSLRQIDTLIICGCSTSGCIRTSTIDCLQHGIRPIIIEDAVADRWLDAHAQALFELNAKYADVISSQTLLNYLNQL